MPALAMLPTLPPAASLADSARGTRVSGAPWKSAAERAQPALDPAGPPTAAGSSGATSARDPAVINHVRAAGSLPGQPGDAADAQAAHSEDGAADSGKAGGAASSTKKADKAEAEQIRKLKARDAEVRAHEQAHAATGGAFAGAPSYEFQRGPDGHNYAVGGEVPIDVSAIPGDPQATIQKMQQVQRAALAPPDPSGADRAIASTASAMILAARRELITEDPKGKTASPGQGTGAAFNTSERRSAGAAAYKSSSAASGDA
jgi:hypothetical protein